MLLDDVTIKVSGGNGGKGAVAFNKNLMSLGPTGGMGGKGGKVVAIGVSDINALHQFRFKKEFKGDDGNDGRGQFRDGHDGKDFVLRLPVGTVIHNLATKQDISLNKVGEQIILANGGLGGRGNFHFRSSKNTSPREFRPGTPGEAFDLRLELKLIADVGFVGLPNVGKSSMLNALTNAQSKVANYPFTTLEPSLGAYYELILADIPGLIEGSSRGKGLGIKFLRHIERTRILFHFISAESPTPKEDYDIIRTELGNYHEELTRKPEYLFITKCDLVDKSLLLEKIKLLKKIQPNVTTLSIHDPLAIKKIERILNEIKKLKSSLVK